MNALQSEPLVLSRTEGAVLRLVLNRPTQRNALSAALMAALQAALDAANDDQGLRVIVLAAAGPVFCSGHDLREISTHRSDADGGRASFREIFAQCSKLMQSIVRHPVPIIAEVQGVATAAGCQLVASCDLAVASTEARFATPGVNIGLFCSTPMVALSRNVSRKQAMEMLLTGDAVNAVEALRIGLINRMAEPQALESETMKLARAIATKPKRAVRTGKEAFYRQLEMPLAEAYAYTSDIMTMSMLEAESKEGIGAFLEKRAPRWPE